MADDFIKREDAINAVLEQLPVCLEMYAVESALMELPAADVRPVVRGRWLAQDGDTMLSACSVCGFPCGAYSFQYCPNCSADMREVDDLVEAQDECDSDSCPIHFKDEPKYDAAEFFSAERSE